MPSAQQVAWSSNFYEDFDVHSLVHSCYYISTVQQLVTCWVGHIPEHVTGRLLLCCAVTVVCNLKLKYNSYVRGWRCTKTNPDGPKVH